MQYILKLKCSVFRTKGINRSKSERPVPNTWTKTTLQQTEKKSECILQYIALYCSFCPGCQWCQVMSRGGGPRPSCTTAKCHPACLYASSTEKTFAKSRQKLMTCIFDHVIIICIMQTHVFQSKRRDHLQPAKYSVHSWATCTCTLTTDSFLFNCGHVAYHQEKRTLQELYSAP